MGYLYLEDCIAHVPAGIYDFYSDRINAAVEVTITLSANVHRAAIWDPFEDLNLAFKGVELAGEVGEACNVIKKLERERLGLQGSRATIEMLAEELADVLICADLVAVMCGIDLEQAVVNKFNSTSKKLNLPTRMTR